MVVKTDIKLRDGYVMEALISGEGRPLVFVHGWAMGKACFMDQLDELSSRYCVIAVDLRGHKCGDQIEHDLSVERLGMDLIELNAQLNLDGAVWVGWSMGAMALWSALTDLHFLDSVSGLVTVDMSPKITCDQNWQFGFSDGRRPFQALQTVEQMRDNWSEAVDRVVPRIVAEGREIHLKDVLAPVIENAKKLNAGTLISLWESMVVQDFRHHLKYVDIPSLTIHGEKSQLYPADTGQFIANTMPNAHCRIMQGAGHAPHMEESSQFNNIIDEFVRSLRGNTQQIIKSVN